MQRYWRTGCASRPPFWKAVTPISTRHSGFALFCSRQARHERRVVTAAKLEPEQFEHVRADFLLRLSKCGTVHHDQPSPCGRQSADNVQVAAVLLALTGGFRRA